jgi:hypothetical protein
MIGFSSVTTPGDLNAVTTTGRDYTPEEWAQMATSKIISVGENSHPAILDQAHAFKRRIEAIIAHTVAQAVASDRAFRK